VWTKSSKNYTPEEIATLRVFEEDMEWSWEYYRGVAARCRAAKPNAGHKALVEIQHYFEHKGKTLDLVTTNIDDLHRRAGSKNVFELHGNLTKARCTNPECKGELIREMPVEEEHATSHIPRCKHCDVMNDTGLTPPLRPHILWFDEGYTEELHAIKSVYQAVDAADLIVTIGGTCTTGGPRRMLAKAHELDIPVIDLNPKPNNDISEVKMHQLLSTADDALPRILKSLQRSTTTPTKGKSNITTKAK
jgi:NAD-dependent deacetylase